MTLEFKKQTFQLSLIHSPNLLLSFIQASIPSFLKHKIFFLVIPTCWLKLLAKRVHFSCSVCPQTLINLARIENPVWGWTFVKRRKKKRNDFLLSNHLSRRRLLFLCRVDNECEKGKTLTLWVNTIKDI